MHEIEQFFLSFIDEQKLDPKTTYVSSFHFELNEYLANELLKLVLIGQ